MVFSSFVFLFGFLPTVLLLYYVSPRALRNPVLLVCSLVFYSWGEPKYLYLLGLVIVCNYLLARIMVRFRKKSLLALGVAGNLLVLGYFKYTPLLGISSVALPIGISFYLFQTISYLVDVYRGTAPVQKNLIIFATYITLFPQLIAGPIVRYGEISAQLTGRRENAGDFASGAQLFVVGLSKKLLLANPMGLLWQQLQMETGTLAAWGGLLAFSFQIYYDFSGYSDMARGLGRLFGFSFEANFDYPYTAKSITEFWRRWHISLSGWFREYVYIPLGGNHKGRLRQICNLFIVWGLTGLWHGASWNFLLWGLYYAVLLTAEKLFLLNWLHKLPAVFRRVYTLLLVMLGWALFYFEDMAALRSFLPRLFAWTNATKQATVLLQANFLYLLAAAFGATPMLRIRLIRNRSRGLVRWGRVAAAGVAALLCIAALAGQGYNPFLYFRF